MNTNYNWSLKMTPHHMHPQHVTGSLQKDTTLLQYYKILETLLDCPEKTQVLYVALTVTNGEKQISLLTFLRALSCVFVRTSRSFSDSFSLSLYARARSAYLCILHDSTYKLVILIEHEHVSSTWHWHDTTQVHKKHQTTGLPHNFKLQHTMKSSSSLQNQILV